MIFVDTSAFIPLVVTTDKFHKKALHWWKENRGVEVITSNIVVIETLGWIRYAGGKQLAVKAGHNLLSGADLIIEKMTIADEMNAWRLFQNLEGRGISMVDCISFVVMKRLKVKEVFTFDQDFGKQGFTVYPK